MNTTTKTQEILLSLDKIYRDAMEPPGNGIGRPDYKTALQALAQQWDIVRHSAEREDKKAQVDGGASNAVLADPESRLRALRALQDAIADLAQR